MKSFDPRAPENQVPANVSRQCGYCDSTFKEMADLRDHFAEKHNHERVWYRFVTDEVPA